MDLKSFDAALWQKVCDEEALSADSWIRENPRPSGPAGNCLCQWCMTTRHYLEMQHHSASPVTTEKL